MFTKVHPRSPGSYLLSQGWKQVDRLFFRRPLSRGGWFAISLALLIGVPSTTEAAVVFNCREADAAGRLQTAIANGGIIELSCSQDIPVDRELIVSTNVTLVATGGPMAIDARGLTRILRILPGAQCELKGITFRKGTATSGGAILNEGILQLSDCRFTGNTATGLAYRITGYVTNALAPGSPLMGVDAILSSEPARGGAIQNEGKLIITDCVFSDNRAIGQNSKILRCDAHPAVQGRVCDYGVVEPDGLAGLGGAIFNSGDCIIESSIFEFNKGRGGKGADNVFFGQVDVLSAGGGGRAAGGGIYQASGTLRLNATRFTANSVLEGDSGRGRAPRNIGKSTGGAVCSDGGNLDISTCEFFSNFCEGIAPSGGALSLAGGTTSLSDCQLETNRTTQRLHYDHPDDLGGGAIHNAGDLSIFHCRFYRNRCIGSGGALWNSGNASLSQTTLELNSTEAADARLEYPGGVSRAYDQPGYGGYGGGLYNGPTGQLRLTESSLAFNVASGGSGRLLMPVNGGPWVAGGPGAGGGLWNRGIANVTNVTFHANRVIGGATTVSPFHWWPGPALGGGIGADSGAITVEHCTFTSNQAIPPIAPSSLPPEFDSLRSSTNLAWGAALFVSATNTTLARLGNSVFGGDQAPGAIEGPVIDLGYNLNADSSAQFTQPTSRSQVDPALGSFGNHGGIVGTVHLLAGSRCLDAGRPGDLVAIDARGVQRPQGTASDIGAYETGGFPELLITLSGGKPQLGAVGTEGTDYTLQTSKDLRQWENQAAFKLLAHGQSITDLIPTLDLGQPIFLRLATP